MTQNQKNPHVEALMINALKNKNVKAKMSNQAQNPNDKKKYDLEERTALFGEAVIRFIKPLPETPTNRPLISQIVRSATSIGANYMEADGAESKKDFRHKVAICKKESKETMHWMRMMATANPDRKDECRKLWQEAHEFTLIFSSILRSKKSSDI